MARRLILLALAVLCLCLPAAAESGTDWRAAYTWALDGGAYNLLIRCNTPREWEEYAFFEADFNGRDQAWDAAALYDTDGDGTPELIVLTVYTVEQIDIITSDDANTIRHLGTLGGDNFFQDFLTFDAVGYHGLIVLSGGPAMDIDLITAEDGGIVCRRLGMTLVNDEGDGTVGLSVTDCDPALYDLLYGELVLGQPTADHLTWCSFAQPGGESELNGFLNAWGGAPSGTAAP
ncbi:MAG: hypothetical protein IKS31_03880 [Clostridia bacterium]|nr:hypothetical protein [Clostridia bacterium]